MTVAELIHEAASREYYGAALIIRRIDPFWQTEIGVDRAWEAKFATITHEKCDCPHCDGCRETRGAPRYVQVEAITAREAADLAVLEIDLSEEFEGVRLLGSNSHFAEPGEDTVQ